MGTGFFLGGIVKEDPYDLAPGDKLDRQADDGAPEFPALGVERATEEEDVEAGKVLDRGGPGEPQIGRDGVAVAGEGPTTGQICEGAPRRGAKEALKQGHDHGAKGRVSKGVHGNILQKESLSLQMTHLTGVEVAVALHRVNTSMGEKSRN